MHRALTSFILLGISTFCGACSKAGDVDVEARPAWIHQQAVANDMLLREVLIGTPTVGFYDGWYGVENDADTGGAWRWMGKRGTVRLRTLPRGSRETTDMELQIHGWVAYENLGLLTGHMEFSVNGHVLDRFEPPRASFVRTIIVPHELLAASEWVDLVITVANTARPKLDWRDLGFATTGFIWKPAGST